MEIFFLTLIVIAILHQAAELRPFHPIALFFSIFSKNIEIFSALFFSFYMVNENFQGKVDHILSRISKVAAKIIWRIFLKLFIKILEMVFKIIIFASKIVIKNAVYASACAFKFLSRQIAA